MRDRNSSSSPVENSLGVAHKLFDAASAYLAAPTESENNEAMLASLGFKQHSFDAVLKETAPPAPGKKKGQTMLGITTRTGLIKAIHRVFPEKADEIVQRDWLYNSEIDLLKADQKQRNQAKTLKATKARPKSKPLK